MYRRQARKSDGQGDLLWVGKDNRVLIRFGDLHRALGPNKRITRARLVLTAALIESPGRIGLRRFDAAWNEGAGRGRDSRSAPQWSTTWEYQFFNENGPTRRWRSGGEEFIAAEPSAETSISARQEEVVLDGLEADVQRFYERWYENQGWAIEFTGEAALHSSQSDRGRPRLEIEYETVAEERGPDLSVIYISRAPEYERYDNRGDAYMRKDVGGHTSGVMMNPGNADAKKWPADGEEVTYTAVIKNVGTENAAGFSYQWSEMGKPTDAGLFEGRLSPGEKAEVSFKTRFRNEHHDHRTQPIGIRVTPVGRDVLAANDYLEIQACALNLGIWVDEGFYEQFAQEPNGIGSRSFEDWIQWQFRIWNEVFMAHSRFSIAPDGSRERVRVQRITIVPDGTLKGGVHTPGDTPTLIFDGEWGFDSSFGDPSKYINAVRQHTDRALLHEMSHQIGLIDMYWMNVDPSLPDGTGGKVRLKHGDGVVTRGMFDLYGGLMGGGDTRNESLIPSSLPLPQDPTGSPVFQNALFEPTDLYSFTSVAAMNANLGFRRGFFGEYLYSTPGIVLVRCVDRIGLPIQEGTLSFYQMKNGAIQDDPPDFTLAISGPSVMLPKRPTGLAEPFTTATGHALRPNPFGRTDVVGTNGVFLVRLDYQGQTEWAFLKVWQLVDARFRGNGTVYVHELRFNVTHRPLLEKDWALNKVALDSADSSGPNLANLLDGDAKTLYEVGGEPGGWVEIDIGRDRPIGEIRLVVTGAHGDFWEEFDVFVYSTGQTVAEARLFARELSWRRAVAQRRDVDPKDFDVRSVSYRALPLTVRYIRLVNRSGGKGRLAGIEILETAPGS